MVVEVIPASVSNRSTTFVLDVENKTLRDPFRRRNVKYPLWHYWYDRVTHVSFITLLAWLSIIVHAWVHASTFVIERLTDLHELGLGSIVSVAPKYALCNWWVLCWIKARLGDDL